MPHTELSARTAFEPAVILQAANAEKFQNLKTAFARYFGFIPLKLSERGNGSLIVRTFTHEFTKDGSIMLSFSAVNQSNASAFTLNVSSRGNGFTVYKNIPGQASQKMSHEWSDLAGVMSQASNDLQDWMRGSMPTQMMIIFGPRARVCRLRHDGG